jgi:hypothetical protein
MPIVYMLPELGIAPVQFIPNLLDGTAMAQLDTATTPQLHHALCGAVELWR